MQIFQQARDLIGIESCTGNEEPVTRYLESALVEMGLPVSSQQVEPGRRNLLAGPQNARVLFCTHTDTVPPHVPLGEDDTFLYGRGACDTKGIAACMLEAGRRLLARGVSDFGYLFVVGEEVDNAGARVANEHVRCEYLIVGEPTEEKIAVGHKGAVAVSIRVQGTACHSAYPEQGDSAIHRLLTGLERLRRVDLGSDPVLGDATLNIGTLSGGVIHNVLASQAEASLMIRIVGRVEDVIQRVEACFRNADGSADDHVELDFWLRMPPHRLERLSGFPETVVSFGTDVPSLSAVGKPILFGPGSILDAHTATEKIEKSAMLRATDAYVSIVERLLARSASG